MRFELADKKTELVVRNAEINDVPAPKLFDLPAAPAGYQAFLSGPMAPSLVPP
jgi:hypothetical protein